MAQLRIHLLPVLILYPAAWNISQASPSGTDPLVSPDRNSSRCLFSISLYIVLGSLAMSTLLTSGGLLFQRRYLKYKNTLSLSPKGFSFAKLEKKETKKRKILSGHSIALAIRSPSNRQNSQILAIFLKFFHLYNCFFQILTK